MTEHLSSPMSPRISVLMSVYNGGTFLEPAIQSILQQTLSDFELIILDDASTDGSNAIITSIRDSRIKAFHNETNQGIANTLNRGLSLAQGAYIAILDQDDLALPTRLELSASFLDSHPEVGMLGTFFRFIDASDKLLPPIRWPVTAEHLAFFLMTGNPICHPSCMYRKSIAEQAGRYDPQDGLAADYGLTFRISRISQLMNIDKVLAYWRIHPGSASRLSRQGQIDCALQIAKRSMQGLLEIPPDDKIAETLFKTLNLSPYEELFA